MTTHLADGIRSNDWHVFWSDDLPFDRDHLEGVLGHRQVTDAQLIALARHNGGRLATRDRGLAALHPEAALLVPVGSG